VTPLWDDLNARSRGLKSHLLGADRLRTLRDTTTLPQLVEHLEQAGLQLAVERDHLSAELVDLALRREAGHKLSLLERWCGERAGVLQVIFEGEDVRSLRALIRGAVAGVAGDTRLEGLVPTRALSIRALTELAQLPNVRAIGSLLLAWGHPYAPVIRSQGEGMIDLYRLELNLAREFLGRSLAASRRGDDYLKSHTRLHIDLENVRSALVLASETHEQRPEDCFVAGGERLLLPRYREAATSGAAAALRLLSPSFARTKAGTVLGRVTHPGEIDDAIVIILRDQAGSAARLDPLSSAPILHYALSLRFELIHLSRLIWSIALGAPAGALAS
jgi:vacuolar-type H+-ATPase subunit C/Vma6